MKKIFLFFVVWLIFNTPAHSAHVHPEKYYQEQWCSHWKGQTEVRLFDRTRVDCLTKNYAVEFDFAPKWAEAVGQSLYYAKYTGKKPAIILILEKPSDFRYYRRAESLAKDYNISIWYIKSTDYDLNLQIKRMKKKVSKMLILTD